ncbi:ExeM/NucH family extracellular endonuclease [Nocardioides sp.]|uniref:ExeM/NucH family extracellular endonuclease n=1 Tax=Nocardioides sp. TaxID=35761 RepID=UPI0039E2F772
MSSVRRGLAALAVSSVAAGGLQFVALSAADANPAGTGLVINEVYVNGGSNGAAYLNKFAELYNPTDDAIALTGVTLQYRSPTGTAEATGLGALTGEVAAHGYYLVKMQSNNASTNPGEELPSPDFDASDSLNPGAGGGTLFLSTSAAKVLPTDTSVVDKLGWGTSNSPEGTAASGNSLVLSYNRTDGVDTDDNSVDFTTAAPTPIAGGTGGSDSSDDACDELSATPTIAAVQGTGETSPYVDCTVTTEGVVTAVYATGGFNGFTIETPGADTTEGASDGLFVYGSSYASTVSIGESVSVTGTVSEYYTYTELTPTAAPTVLTESLGEVEPRTFDSWSDLDTDAEKEEHESELITPPGDFVVSDNYDANYYASFLLASGEEPLKQPTEYADASDTTAIAAIAADNAARAITLDDGQSLNFNSTANKATALPWLTTDNPVRVGSAVTFNEDMVLDYRNSLWSLQPTTPVTDDGSDVVTFSDTRSDNLAPQDVGGDLKLATFNVLNYFPTTGAEIVADGGSCTFYSDRDGKNITVNSCTTADGGDGPRGAADADNLARQQVKIVQAINGLDASVVSLEELENSVMFGKDRDYAIGVLVDALNAAAGAGTWAYAPSPTTLPDTEEQDVIRTGFIYKPADVELVGTSYVLSDESASGEAFESAREPLAQAFKPAGGSDEDAFLVIVNHFKSKGSGTDDGTGQGYANPDRVAQATSLAAFADEVETEVGTDKVFLTGDFNAYSMEDPVQVLEDAGYTELNGAFNDGEATYSYDGLDGSLDHVFANAAAKAWVTGVDVWQINAQEQVGFEYSRYNYNATILYENDVFRASDHNPEIVGLDLPEVTPASGNAGDNSGGNSGTNPQTVEKAAATFLHPKVSPKPVRKKGAHKLSVVVASASGVLPTGTVTVSGRALRKAVTATIRADGSVVIKGLRFKKKGKIKLTLSYSGDAAVAATTMILKVKVRGPKK